MPGIVRAFERRAAALRHHSLLESQERIWNVLRPAYDALVGFVGRQGLTRTINGTDPMRILPQVRGVSEVYEPEVWAYAMRWIRPGSVVVDAGAHIGLYTVAFAQRVGNSGRVIAFEPDPGTFPILQRHVTLNGLEGRVELHQVAVSDRDGEVWFDPRGELESRVRLDGPEGGVTVRSATLDSILAGKRVDLLKIDVEGFEVHALRGASALLADPDRAPRAIFIEAHVHLWNELGITDTDLLGFLTRAGYRPLDVRGEPIRSITHYMEVIGLRNSGSVGADQSADIK